MPANRPNRETVLDRESTAWELRCKGYTHERIARRIGVTRRAVGLILDRVEKRELKRLAASVERQKVTQTGQLEHVVDESLRAWRKSKQPRNRVVASGANPKSEDIEKTEVVDQTGDPRYLAAAMEAMDRIRDLWGLNVQAAAQDSAGSVAEIVREMSERARRYEDRRAQADPAGDSPGAGEAAGGGAGPVQAGPEPVQ